MTTAMCSVRWARPCRMNTYCRTRNFEPLQPTTGPGRPDPLTMTAPVGEQPKRCLLCETSSISLRGTLRRRENGVGSPVDVDRFLGV